MALRYNIQGGAKFVFSRNSQRFSHFFHRHRLSNEDLF